MTTLLPAGTVTFLFTDIENSAGHWEQAPAEMREALAAHDRIVADVVAANGGVIVKHLGDGCWAAFASAQRATQSAIAMQRKVQHSVQEHPRLRVRVGLHTGDVEPTEGDYFGPVPNRTARVVDLANADQIVCSSATAGLLDDIEMRDEGLHELRGIGTDQIFVVLSTEIRTSPDALRRPVKPSMLPHVRTSFVGRSADVQRAMAYLAHSAAVVTLVGPGGVGKTRLALEVGERFADSFDGEVQFCDLMPIGDPNALAAAVADALGARRQPGMDLVDSIVDYISGREVLLILDTCEHIVRDVRSLIERLTHATDVRVLATSREGIGIAGEQVAIVSPLTPETDGVELFVDRATHLDPTFELTAANEAHVCDVVERLDGIPLAIELAAARVRLMTPMELAQRLRERSDVLGRSRRRDRHETLHQTVSWSYNLLSEPEAALFARLSVFVGGFDLVAVEVVCGDDGVVQTDEIPDLLMALVDKSMVVSRSQGGRRRFSLLETLRRFAEDKLHEAGAVAEFGHRHAVFYRDLAAAQGERIFTAAEPDAWRVLDDEWSNVRAAFDEFLAADDLDAGADIVIALVWYATAAMRFELFAWADKLLEIAAVERHAAFGDLCGAAAVGAYFTLHGDSTALANAGLAADPADRNGFCHAALSAVFLNNLLAPHDGDVVTRRWLETEPATPGNRLWAHAFRAFLLATHGQADAAAQHASATAAFAKETQSITAHAVAAWAEGLVVSIDSPQHAIDIWTEGLEWPRAAPDDHLLDHLIVGLILHFRVRRDDLRVTAEMCRRALSGAIDRHYYAGTSHLFGVTAIALCRAGDAETGARLVGAMIANGHVPRSNAIKALDEAFGDDVQRHLDLGSSLSVTQAGQLALRALDAVLVD